MKVQGKPLCAITLDIAKAFHTVSHNSVNRALERLGVEKKFRSYMQANLNDRGVNQGDSILPILFNVVLRSAHADDLVVFARAREDGERMAEAVREILCSRWMNLNAAISGMLCFRTVPSKKRVAADETPLKCGTE
uniref:Reverse transcriptase domain-containing protein n=1 Tax=Glossina pallidipes TaxID=7398 RepID=A0A1B0A955_GLOPL